MGLDLGLLALLAALGYAATVTLHRRLLETPETAGPRVSRAPMRVRTARFPGLSAAAAATAAAQLLVLLRTVRGKMLLLSPLFTTTLFAVAFTRADGRHAAFLAQPVAIAGIAVLIALANLSSVTCNQLAADDSALVLEFLQPLGERDLLLGKFAGSTVVFAASVSIALLPLFVIFPGVSPALLLAVLLGGLATHFVLAPVNALLSAVFPQEGGPGQARRGRQAALGGGPPELRCADPSLAPRRRLHPRRLAVARPPRAGPGLRRGAGDRRRHRARSQRCPWSRAPSSLAAKTS